MSTSNLKLADQYAKDYDKSIANNNWEKPHILYQNTIHLFKAQSQILDLGIGTGESSRPFQEVGHQITGIDGSILMLEECRKKKIGTKLILRNIEESILPLENITFDLVVSHAVFHLIYPIKQLFKEIGRILQPNGIFAFTYENTNSILRYNKIKSGVWSKKSESGVQTYKYSENYINKHLSQNQFKIKFQKRYLAYRNSELNQEFYFNAIVARFLPEQ